MAPARTGPRGRGLAVGLEVFDPAASVPSDPHARDATPSPPHRLAAPVSRFRSQKTAATWLIFSTTRRSPSDVAATFENGSEKFSGFVSVFYW
jgi:hypothetical protein